MSQITEKPDIDKKYNWYLYYNRYQKSFQVQLELQQYNNEEMKEEEKEDKWVLIAGKDSVEVFGLFTEWCAVEYSNKNRYPEPWSIKKKWQLFKKFFLFFEAVNIIDVSSQKTLDFNNYNQIKDEINNKANPRRIIRYGSSIDTVLSAK